MPKKVIIKGQKIYLGMCNKSYFKSQFMSFSIRRKRWVCEHTMPCRLLSSQNNGYIKKNLKRCLVKNSVTIFSQSQLMGIFPKNERSVCIFDVCTCSLFIAHLKLSEGTLIKISTCNFLHKTAFCLKCPLLPFLYFLPFYWKTFV